MLLSSIKTESTCLTVLCDDELDEPLIREHGFSVLVEQQGESPLLFDTGHTDVFLRNAEIIGKNLLDVENVVISHGHYDHAGGLRYLANLGKKFNVFLREDSFLPKYSGERFTGVEWNTIKDKFSFTVVNDKILRISQSMYVFGPARLSNTFEEPDSKFFVEKNGQRIRDFFEEELNLVIDEGDGIILITGCAHRGIVNIAKDATELFGKQIKLLMGGFHLYNLPESRVKKIIDALTFLGVKKIISYHCSGELIKEMLKDAQ
ncbi:MAG: MBL fold metallo-hydrolase [Fervidobacterium sp.]|uniref:MBL fold metallo-hydrolase n=1 Tax=Fervidobacterium sp. TaxID=1871331 RepID=UPI00404944F6